MSLHASDLLKVEVPTKQATAVAKMTDDRLGQLWLLNALPAAVAGPGSVFYHLQAAVCQEMKRRGLKAKGMLE